ncbi:peptidoglycan synthetase [Arcobacter cryaerophilus gv. pseudocryaerophilus]|uniref:Peptidoglycan synthetase n=3 Tax=unclassified Arcobacter TaxID=2593671 RepID=A0AA96IDB2_9BACT|nr:peptidoglycan synthetase [Arcobacter sp. AZ-2023]WPD04750.1 peptidoglycan synthetase [Arcobacter sp. DSM 115956]WPD06845.1 peptidoglycan synthetase [Arcobacter sp. DSM 115955]WNL31110.1 peptidoglycan synthetase [Arcobacter sp. AZ-2023]WNP37260.1 peptidoglycan synthetase [Arcobacter sp. AZ-2023]
MKISSIVDIVDGELLNSPSISFINNISSDSNKVKTSDMFIAKNIEDLKIALQNGAYAVIFEKDFEVIDNEIAFIKVKNLELALLKIVRYKLSTLKIKSYFCTDETFDMLKLYQNNHTKPIFLISKNIEKAFKFIDDIKDGDILISKNKKLLENIYPDSKEFEKKLDENSIKNLIKHSLFELSFSYKDIYFSKLRLSKIYLNSFLNIYDFFKGNIDISKLKLYSNFKAIFIDKDFQPIESGKSDSFIICQTNKNLIPIEITYLKNEFRYAKTIFISKYKISFLDEKEQIIINNIEDLKNILKNLKFNCVYLIGFTNQESFEFLQNSQKLQTLF